MGSASTSPTERRWLRLGPAADLLGVSINTLRRWSDAGKVACYRSAGGHRRFRRVDIEAMLRAGALAGTGGEPAAPSGDTDAIAALQARNRGLELLVEAGEDAARLSTDDVLESVARRLARLTHSPVADIYAVEGRRLRSLVSYDHGVFDRSWEGTVFDLRDFPVNVTAINERRVCVIASLDDPALSAERRAALERWGYQSQLCAPLIVRDAVIGILELSDHVPRDFGEHLELIAGLAHVAGRALDNALLFEEIRRRNDILHELVEFGALVTGAEDLTTLLRAAAKRLVDVLGAADCDVFTLEGDHLLSRVSYDHNGYDEAAVGHTLELDDFASARAAIESQQIRVVASPTAQGLDPDERRVFEQWGFKSSLSLPLVVDGVVKGLIDIYDDEPNDFAEYLDFLQTVGQLLAGALDKARLLDCLEDSNHDLRELVDSGLEFGSTLELDEVLRSVGARLRSLANADECQILGLEGPDLVVRICVGRDRFLEGGVGQRRPLDEQRAAERATRTRQPVVVRDAAADDDLTPQERSLLTAAHHRASIHLPLVVRDEVVGLVALFDREPREFVRLPLLQGLAQVAAQAMANATLYRALDESRRRLALISEASLQLASTLELPDVLRATADRLCEVGMAPSCDLHLVSGSDLVCVASVKEGEIVPDWIGTLHPLEGWPAVASAVATRDTVQLCSLDDPRRGPIEVDELRRYGYEAELVVPLIAKGRVIGVADLLDRERREFSPGTVGAVEAVCRAAAFAIDNANLFEAVQLRSRETELLNAIARRTASSLELHEIAAATVEELRQIVAFERAELILADGGERLETIYSSDERDIGAGPREASTAQRAALEAIRRELVVVWEGGAAPSFDGRGGDGDEAGASIALLHDDQLIGVLDLSGSEPHDFSSVDRHVLERVGTHLAVAIHNARLYDEIKRMHLGNLKALTSALNAKDYYTLGHAARVGAYMVLLGHELGWSEETIRQVEEAAYLHDIGKIGVSDRVLLKPSGLNSLEWELMRQHPIFSADILRPLFEDDLVLGVRHHHEHWDGAGYPDGLAGKAIPLVARAMCVADSYDAMSFRRPYRQALRYHEALAELDRCSGTQFDPEMVSAFTRVLARLAEQRAEARSVAALGAARVDPDQHEALRTSRDEDGAAYRRIASSLRAIRNEHPEVRFLTTIVVDDDGECAIIVDPEETAEEHSLLGSKVFADDELLETFAGGAPDINVLYVDEWGVWVTGLAVLRDAHGRIVAVVEADVPPAGVSGAEMRGLRSDVARAFASMFQAAAARPDRAALDAITDGLTGLYNHRYLHERLSEEVGRARDDARPLSLLFCGLDNFKAFNERFGHSAGDDALRGVARVIDSCIRHIDLAARYSGEEFALILMGTDPDTAAEVAERLRREVAAISPLPGQEAPLTVSIGLASYPADADLKEELLDKADWAMRLAKRLGRDRVVVFSAGQSQDGAGEMAYESGEAGRS
jgi:diguanylate cyclase (GGDEF)-like protein/excisionase family DNA binding protein